MIKESVGAKIRELRLQKGITQEELAQKSQLAVRFLQDIEAANKQPSVTTVFKVTDGLGISISELLDSSFKARVKADKPNG